MPKLTKEQRAEIDAEITQYLKTGQHVPTGDIAKRFSCSSPNISVRVTRLREALGLAAKVDKLVAIAEAHTLKTGEPVVRVTDMDECLERAV